MGRVTGLLSFPVALIKFPHKSNLMEKRFLLLIVEGTHHQGGAARAWNSCSHPQSGRREQWLHVFISLFPTYAAQDPNPGNVTVQSRQGSLFQLTQQRDFLTDVLGGLSPD